MSAQDFVGKLRTSVVDANLATYQELFTQTTIDGTTDPYWVKALQFFSSLTPVQRDTFFEIIRQVEVDTMSNLLGILDGSSFIGEGFDSLQLLNAGDILSGELQGMFLNE